MRAFYAKSISPARAPNHFPMVSTKYRGSGEGSWHSPSPITDADDSYDSDYDVIENFVGRGIPTRHRKP